MAGNHCWIKLLWCVASKHKKYQIDSRLKYFSSPLIGLMPCKNVPESFEETSSVQKKGPFAVRSQKGEKGSNSSHFSKVNKLLNCRWIANKKYNFSPLTMELFFPWVFNSFVGTLCRHQFCLAYSAIHQKKKGDWTAFCWTWNLLQVVTIVVIDVTLSRFLYNSIL